MTEALPLRNGRVGEKRDRLCKRYLGASPRRRAFVFGRRCRSGGGCLNERLFLLALGLGGGGVPVVDHLRGDDGVQGETGDEGVQDQRVVHFLQGREDARERAGKVVEDLGHVSMSAKRPSVRSTDSRDRRTAKALSWPVPP